MMCRKFVPLVVTTLLFFLTGVSQSSKVDPQTPAGFEGTWVVDDDYIRTMGNQTWTISVKGNIFRITKDLHYSNSRREVTLLLEKKWEEEKHADGSTTRSRAYWKKGKVVREYTYRRQDPLDSNLFGPRYSNALVTETYYLSNNGAKLVFRRDDDSVWPNRNTPTKMGRGFEHKLILRRKN